MRKIKGSKVRSMNKCNIKENQSSQKEDSLKGSVKVSAKDSEIPSFTLPPLKEDKERV